MFDGLGFLLLQEIFFCRVLDIRVSKIMKTYLFQLVLCQENLEMLGDEIGLHQFSNGVHIDVIQVVTTVMSKSVLKIMPNPEI